MGILSHQEQSDDSIGPSVIADSLRDRQDVSLGEGPAERCAPMPARAKAHELMRIIEGRDVVRSTHVRVSLGPPTYPRWPVVLP